MRAGAAARQLASVEHIIACELRKRAQGPHLDQTSQISYYYTDAVLRRRKIPNVANRSPEEHAQSVFRDVQEEWRRALESHRLAPPDAGFSSRLSALASAAAAEAAACREADAAGFEWPPHRASANKPPYELQPGTGRRGPDALWRVFDAAVAELNRAATGTDLIEVATAYDALAAAASSLPRRSHSRIARAGFSPRTRARRSA